MEEAFLTFKLIFVWREGEKEEKDFPGVNLFILKKRKEKKEILTSLLY